MPFQPFLMGLQLPSYLSQKGTPKRSSPRKRRRLAMEHHENKQTSWLNLDEIKSYNAFKTEVSNKIRSEFPGTELHIQECTDHMLIYKLSDGLDVTLNPKINFAMRILQDLSIKMWINNVEILSQQNFHIVTWTRKYRMYQNCYVSPDL